MTTQDKTFNEAKQLYMEQYGNAIVTNTYLKIALFLMAVGLVLSLVVNLKTIRTFKDFRPLVIRIDDVGRAEAVNYHDLEYKPQDAEAKYFLTEFCRLYYRRNRFTIQDDFSKSVYFLDGPLANATLDAFRKSNAIKTFLSNQNGPDIDIDVKKVALEDMATPPYRARVDFYMVYNSAADRSEIRRVLYTANFVFFFKSNVPNDLIPINPLGMAISYFREDEAFE
jgi:type IV secretion system protein VirB5